MEVALQHQADCENDPLPGIRNSSDAYRLVRGLLKMSNQSNGDKLEKFYKKALSTSMLIHLSEEEMLSLSDSWQKNQGCSFGPGCRCRSEKPSSRQQPPTEER